MVFGKTDGTPVNLTDVVAGEGGFVMNGIASGDYSGSGVSGGGDINGDGLADVIVGARRAWGGAVESGRSYVVFSPVVRADVDGDGSVGIVDLLLLLAVWGRCTDACPPFCSADIDGDCAVGLVDLLMLLAGWS